MRTFMTFLLIFSVSCAVPPLHPLLSGVRGYCKAQMDCVDGNAQDVKACVVGIQNERRWARQYGCQADYAAYIDCFKEESECVEDGRWAYDCSDEASDYVDCLEDESDAYEFGY